VFTCPAADVSTAAGSVGTCTGAGSAFPGSTHQKTNVGEGVGGSVLLPIIPKYLDVTASTMYGRGIGRYGASQLQDVYVGADGSLQTITAFHGLVGAILHPWAGLDIYGYAGIEKEQSGVWANLAGTGGVSGFGVPNLVNAGCYITTSASFTGGTSNCAAVNKLVSGATLGFWQDVYKGPMGRVATGTSGSTAKALRVTALWPLPPRAPLSQESVRSIRTTVWSWPRCVGIRSDLASTRVG
jgi:hypothetical protein